jgi:hypothetical protein
MAQIAPKSKDATRAGVSQSIFKIVITIGSNYTAEKRLFDAILGV